MAALDDYRVTCPTWLLILRTLDEVGALKLAELGREVYRRAGGCRGWDVTLLRRLLFRLIDDGLVMQRLDEPPPLRRALRPHERSRPRRVDKRYVLTDEGRAFVVAALNDARAALGLDVVALAA